MIDKHSALGAYKQKHKNDTSYLTQEQTANFKKDGKGSSYIQPEIRIEKQWNENLIDLLKANETVSVSDWNTFEFVEANLVGIKGKKFYQVRDNEGYFNYFITRSLKNFLFYGRYPYAVDGKSFPV